MTDKVTINSSWADLDKAAKEIQPGPFVQGLPGNKRITFPDPMSMDWIEVEDFLKAVIDSPNSESFKRFLSAEDYQKLTDASPSLAHILEMSKRVWKHYNSIKDALGELAASQS